MAITNDTLERMRPICERIIGVGDSLHLTKVAKAIEMERGCQIFMEPLTDENDLGGYHGFTANCDPWNIIEPKDQEKWQNTFVQHFVYFKTDKDPDVECYRIAHELGHLAAHWPLESDRDRINRQLPTIGSCFLVLYNQEEEEEADAFAMLLGYHKPEAKRFKKIRLTNGVKNKIEDYEKRGLLISSLQQK